MSYLSELYHRWEVGLNVLYAEEVIISLWMQVLTHLLVILTPETQMS